MAGTLPAYVHDSFGRNSRPSSPARQPITVDIWLDSLGLVEYLPLFSQYRFVQDLLSFTELDLRDQFGIKNGAHRARLASNLVMMRETFQRQRAKTKTPTQFDTVSSSLPSLHCGVNSPGGSPHYGGSDYSVPRTSIYQPSAAPSSFSPAANYYASPKSLAVENIKANAWYHGPISRIAAEEMVRNNGDFLIRDSSTQHGDFVLTTRWNGQPLHFVVNRRPVPGVPARSAYHFEEDAFETVADLINFYVKHRKPVTEASGAVIAAGVPCFGAAPRESQSHRQQPVALAKYGSQPLLNSAFDSCAESGPQTLERRLSVPSIAKMTAVDISIEGGQHAEAASGDGGQSITGGESVFSPVTLDSHSPAALPKAVDEAVRQAGARTGSDTDLSRPPPPKPSRVPTIKVRISPGDKRPIVPIRNQALYDDDGKDYSDYDQVRRWPEKTAASSSEQVAEATSPPSPSVGGALASRYECDDVISYESQFLTPDNRPLESSAVTLMKSMIFDTSPATLAKHITRIDIDLLRIVEPTDLGCGINSGLELITLPQGRFLRQDVIERFHCLRLFVSVLVLKCSSATERARMINVWIQTAIQLQSPSFGDLYAFSAIMHALLGAPISRLTSLWLQLRQQYGPSSIAFENRLCSLQRALDSASTTAPVQRPTVPYVLPLVELLEGATAATPLTQWHDIDAVLGHLVAARAITAESKAYQRNADAVLAAGGNGAVDPALVDMLGTPTHMRLLWGTRGVGVDRAERLAKFEQVIAALSEKIEPRESSL